MTIMSQRPLQMSLKAKHRQTFSKGFPLTVHGIKSSLKYHFRFSCVMDIHYITLHLLRILSARLPEDLL